MAMDGAMTTRLQQRQWKVQQQWNVTMTTMGNVTATAMEDVTAMRQQQWQWMAPWQRDDNDGDGWRDGDGNSDGNGNGWHNGNGDGRRDCNTAATTAMDGTMATQWQHW